MKPAEQTGAQAMVASLQNLGVDRVFVDPSFMHHALFSAFASSSLGLVLTTLKQSAFSMAGVHARLVGRPAVCGLAGLFDAASGLARAFLDSLPLLVLVTSRVGQAQQDQAHLAALRSICKKIVIPTSAKEIPLVMTKSYALAQADIPGPVLIGFSNALQSEHCRTLADSGAQVQASSPALDQAPADSSWLTKLSKIRSRSERTDSVDPIRLFLYLRELMTASDVLIVDSKRLASTATRHFPPLGPGSFLMMNEPHDAGLGVPAAISACLARPANHVVACLDESGFLQTGMELLTARRCDVAPLVVVGVEKPLADDPGRWFKRMLQRQNSQNSLPLDYQLMAQALGLGYKSIRHDGELYEVLQRSLMATRPVLVEVVLRSCVET
jgi:thiamine pyrophosphate-dependent acetolactate synthase large subunit-like protein